MLRLQPGIKLIGILALCGSGAPAVAQHVDPAAAIYTMALTGDSIITRRLSVYEEPEYLAMLELIRGADVAFTNLEMLFHDYEPYPMHQSGGTYMRGDPALAKELAWAGFDIVSTANNHSGDYGALGMRLTWKHAEAAGLVHAGTGNSLEQAREARFIETTKARVALISMASTFPDHSRAGSSRGDIPARPGLNPLRFSTTYTVTRELLESWRALLSESGLPAPAQGDTLRVFGRRLVGTGEVGVRTAPNVDDLRQIGAVVRNAARLADYTVVTIHAHEGMPGDRFVPAEFLVELAHAMIDAGADVFVGHGPHVLRGIEIYKGKPILYSLGDFIFQNETLLRLPEENYARYDLGPDAHVGDFNNARYDNDTTGFPARPEIWESVVAVPKWRGRRLQSLRLYPITLGYGKARTVRGRPMFADDALGGKILDDMIRLSAPFGTRVEVENGVGVIRPAR